MSLDLSKLGFRVRKSAAEQSKVDTASVSAIILSSGNDELVAKAQGLLSAHGINLTQHTEFEDGTIAIHKEDEAFIDNGTIVRLNSTTAVVLGNMGSHLTNLKKSAFGEIAESNGYFDGPSLVMETATEAIREGVQKAESPADASTIMRDSMESVQQYLGYLTMAIPSAVMKVEAELETLVKAEFVPGKKGVNPFAKKKPVEGTAEEKVDESTEEEDAEVAAGKGDRTKTKKAVKNPAVAVPEAQVAAVGAEAAAAAESDTTDNTEGIEDTATGPKKKVPVTGECTSTGDKIKKADEILKGSMTPEEKTFMADIADGAKKFAFMRMTTEERAAEMSKAAPAATKKSEQAENNVQIEKVLKAMSEMASAVANLTKNVGTLSADITMIKKSTEEKIDVLAKKAETATHAVRGTVLASETAGDPQPIAKIKKVDNDPRTGVFDSAMIARNR